VTPRSRPSTPEGRAIFRAGALCFALSSLAPPALAQEADSERERAQVTGSVTVTNQGISTIPSFTLGKPAAILDLAIRKGGLGFEPQFRHGLDGKPWSFLFWARYRLRFAPQVYYLRVDERDGYYLNAGVTLASQGFPVSISSQANRVIQTRIPGGDELIWNVSVSYALR
jgi:hypothetical protein